MPKRSLTFTWNAQEFPDWDRFYEEFRPRDTGDQQMNARRLVRWMRRELNQLAAAYYAGGGTLTITVEPTHETEAAFLTEGEINAMRWATIPEREQETSVPGITVTQKESAWIPDEST